MSDINRVILKGRIGNELDLKKSAQDVSYLKLSIATNSFRGDTKEKSTHWHRVIVFGAQAIACATHLRKGSEVLVEGSLEVRTFTGSDGQKVTLRTVRAQSVSFLGGFKKVELLENGVAEDDVIYPQDENHALAG